MKYQQTWKDCFSHHQTQKDIIIQRIKGARLKAKYSMDRWNSLYEVNRQLSDRFWALSDEYHSTGDSDKSIVNRMNIIIGKMSRNSEEMDLCWKLNHKD